MIFIGKLEFVVVGVVVCIYVFIEIEYWRCVCNGIVQEVYQCLIVVLSEKLICMVFYLYFVFVLVLMNFDIVGVYGVFLLRVGEEILKSVVDFWQYCKVVVKLLQGVFIIFDKEILEIEFDLVICVSFLIMVLKFKVSCVINFISLI